MKSNLLILSLVLGSLGAKAQVVDISASGVPFEIHTASDTFYSEFNVFAGLQVTGDDKGHVLINVPDADNNEALTMVDPMVTLTTKIDDVILELTEDMKLNLKESKIPDINGGLKLGLNTEILNENGAQYVFPNSQQYRYVEQFGNGRSTMFAPTLQNAERDSLRFGDGSGDNSLTSIHLWDNETVSYVTGYATAAERASWPAAGRTTGSDGEGSTGTEDYTVYNAATKGYTHYEVDGGQTYVSEEFLPKMVDNGRAVVVYYGNKNGASTDPTSMDSIYSHDGFHDGDITLDITNQHPSKGLFRHWHMIGNPYQQALDLTAYLAEPLTGTHSSEVNGYFGGRTISLYTDINTNTAGFDPGYAVINAAGVVIGINNEETDVSGNGLPTIDTIAPGQGFFVFHTANPGTTVTTEFTNAMRVRDDVNLQKIAPNEEPSAFINVKQLGDFAKETGSKKWNQLAFTISEDIDPNFYNAPAAKQDLSIDGEVLMSTRDINIYTQNSHKDEFGYAIQSLKPSNVNKLIPVGFETKQGNVNYEFSLSNSTVNMEDYDVFIVDRLTNSVHNISKNGPYTCNVFQPGQQQDRFFLKFGHAEEDGFVEELDIFSNGNFVNVLSNSQNTEIQNFVLFDVLGKEVINIEPKTYQSYEFDIRNLPRGVYFVKVTANGKEYNSKVLNNNN